MPGLLLGPLIDMTWIVINNKSVATHVHVHLDGQGLHHIIIWQGKSERSDWFFLGQDFAIRTVSVEMVISCVFLFSKAGKLKTSIVRVPYNKLLTNLASSSCTGEY